MSTQGKRRLSDEIQLVRQPIFSAGGQVEAYQLLTRSDTLLEVFSSLDETVAASKLLADTFLDMDVWSLTGGLPAYLRFPSELLMNEVPAALPPDIAVLQLTDDAAPTAELVAVCEQYRAMGYTLALGGLSDRDNRPRLREVVDIVKVDVGRTTDVLQERILEEARAAGRRVVAENVDTREQEAAARLLGYDAFQGRFFQQPSTVRSQRVAGSRATYLQLLALANAPVIDFHEVADLIKRDVSLAWKFLNYINSAFFGWKREIESIERGVVMLGETGVRRWVSLVAVGELGDSTPQSLAVDAVCRARWSERIVERLPDGPRPLSGFLVGMFSLLDAMLDQPMDEILGHVSVSDEVRDALLDGQGTLGAVLDLIVAHERGDWDTVEGRAAAVGVEPSQLTAIYLEALSWAHSALDRSPQPAR